MKGQLYADGGNESFSCDHFVVHRCQIIMLYL